MSRALALIIVIGGLAVFGCAKGKDGEDGSVYAYPTWSSDITAADFSEAGVTDSVIYYNRRYKLQPGPARIKWISNLSPSTIWYLDVSVEDGTSGEKGKDAALPLIGKAEDGDDGKDRVYKTYFSYNTMTTTDEYLTEIGTASTVVPSVSGGIIVDPTTSVLSPGVFAE